MQFLLKFQKNEKETYVKLGMLLPFTKLVTVFVDITDADRESSFLSCFNVLPSNNS